MRKVLPTLLILVLIGVLGNMFFKTYWVRYTYSDELADLDAHYGVRDEADLPVILQDALSDYHARLIDGEVYFTIDDVHELFNERFYYSEEDGVLLYCLPDGILRAQEGASEWTDADGETHTEQYRPCVLEGETLYVALPYVKPFANFEYEMFGEPNRICMYTAWGEQKIAEVRKATQVRNSGGIKSEIVSEVPAGTKVILLDEMENWSKVMTEDAHIGYLENKTLGEAQMVSQTPVADYTEPVVEHNLFEGRINMGWHQIAGAGGNLTLGDRMAQTQAVNIVAPTWLVVKDQDGSLEIKASRDYVSEAHAGGLQVWAVLDNFNAGEMQEAWLRREESRRTAIEEAMEAADDYGFDGINVDIEGISSARGDDFREFIRELSIACREKGLILSVDNYVPYNFNDYYGLDEQALFADYVVIMGYDEHYGGSQEPGSVASLGYVEYGISEALKEVPADRLINGIPFYTRIWKTNEEGVSSVAYGMRESQQFMSNHGMEQEWDEIAGQYYAEASDDEYLYQCWVEDEDSIRCKLEVMESYGIAGVAEWALGLEDPAVWYEIAAYMERAEE